MHKNIFEIHKKRIDKFLAELQKHFFFESRDLNAEISPSPQPVHYNERLNCRYQPIKEGEKWGDLWDNAWIHLTGSVPAEWAGKPVYLDLELGGEILVFDADGVPVCGLTDTSVYEVNYKKSLLALNDCVKEGENIDLYVEVAAHGLFGEEVNSGRYVPGVIKKLRFGHFNNQAWALYNDIQVLNSLLDSFDKQSARSARLCMTMNECAAVYADNPVNAAEARAVLEREFNYRACDSELTATAIGHAHIDVGWYWPVKESIRKAARSFSSQLNNMDKYPSYVFGASQPQLYAFIKAHYPEIYEAVRQKVKEGRWELQGAMWVEADCNIISGESMIRQFVHGKNFYRDEFGVEVKNLWLPDVFGYSSVMPQIIRKSGCDFFLTQKISWSEINHFPYHSFIWQGLGNYEVITHFPPEDTYNSRLLPEKLIGARDHYNENVVLDEFLCLFGVGDGGGGPRPEHIEHGLRQQNLEGCPKVKFGRADDFFQRIEKSRSKLPKWCGELYLERHRGTLTSQARTKRNNRKCEHYLSAIEFFFASLPLGKYPVTELDSMWKTLLCNQFHDIIPGSSIREVYEVTEVEHAEILRKCQSLTADAVSRICKDENNSISFFNSLSYEYTHPVSLPEDWIGFELLDDNGNKLPLQREGNSLFVCAAIPPFSFFRIKRGRPASIPDAETDDNKLHLENELVSYTFDSDARLIYALDKTTGLEVINSGCANIIKLFVDTPFEADAWDIDLTYLADEGLAAYGITAKRKAYGGLRQVLEFELEIASSKIRQQIVLTSNSKRLDFITEIDWHESHRMLRTVFPVNVNAEEAICDIQYGYVKRPTHTNTSWEKAKFEVAAHRYVKLTDHSGGAALMNDCKYGYRLSENELDLNLLRSPRYPDAAADKGTHYFTYSFYPCSGDMEMTPVIREAACLNREPLRLKGRLDIVPPVKILQSNGVSLEVVKKAEKENCIVIRLVETEGSSSQIELATKAAKFVETDLMEWNELAELKTDTGRIMLKLKPFEIRTFKLVE